MSISVYREKIDKLKARRNLLLEIESRERKALQAVNICIEDIKEAREIAQSVAQAIQEEMHTQISVVVTRCLEAVFDNPYEFKLRFVKKRGKTEAELVLVRDGREYDDPLNDVGGGVIDIVSLALRLSCVMLAKPLRQRLLVLDEPFRNVRGQANKQRLRSLLLSLADEIGFQFILNVDADAYPEFVLGTTIKMGE